MLRVGRVVTLLIIAHLSSVAAGETVVQFFERVFSQFPQKPPNIAAELANFAAHLGVASIADLAEAYRQHLSDVADTSCWSSFLGQLIAVGVPAAGTAVVSSALVKALHAYMSVS